MYILGINAFHGDSSACLFKDGQLIVAIEEERIRRIKHWAGFPTEAIKICLSTAKITASELDYITIGKNPSANLIKKIQHTLTKIRNFNSLIHKFYNQKKTQSIKSILSKELAIDEQEIKAEIHNIEHHRSHIGSSFFASPFEEAAILSVDGFGDFTSTMLAYGKGNKIKILDTVTYPHSLGGCYNAFTQYLGFPHYGDEYKVMGLAPYGNPIYLEDMKKIILLNDNGLFALNNNYFKYAQEAVPLIWENGAPVSDTIFTEKLEETFGKARKKGEEITQHHKDIAASLQKMTELAVFHLLNHLYQKTKITNLCLAGGVAQNSVANGKIYKNTPFRQSYIPPAATDAGNAIGSALFLYNQILDKPRIKPILTADLGVPFDINEIKQLLDDKNLIYEQPENNQLIETVVNCLITGGVVGWFTGKSEFGPRALGYRSILADPRRNDARDILNEKIKRREKFRPFAPSILKEYVNQYFEQDDTVRFMEKVFMIKEEKRTEIPAVTHINGTGRLQTVDKQSNPKYYQLIDRFRQKTGVPLILNTSFNENEPIVNTPHEALDCFLRTQMDMLVLENFVIIRKNQTR